MSTTSAQTRISISQPIRRMLTLLIWMASLYGTLQIHRATGLFGHAICGRWGCGPPVEALISYHGFWFVLLIPLGFLFAKTTRQRSHGRLRLRRWGFTLAVASLLTLLGFVIVDAIEWLSTTQSGGYLVQRCLFRVATLVDVPLLPIVCVGLIWVWQSRMADRAGGNAVCQETVLADGANLDHLSG